MEQTREHRAEELLATAGLTVEQVAKRLGYAEASSFVHAFRRWEGSARAAGGEGSRSDGAR